jgi:tetratricopeptide (TPR) repeat protein
MDRLIELLQISNLSWLLPNLRQDFVIWNSLNNPAFYEKFIQSKSSGSEYTASDFSPSRLVLIALDQFDFLNKIDQDFLESIDNQILQTAIRSFNDRTLFQTNPQDLQNVGHITLALANNYLTTNSWTGLLNVILDFPGDHWFSPLVCLYGFFNADNRILNALVQPGASSLRLNLAVHVVLSNPITTEDQINILIGLCKGEYGDLLPANDRLALVRSLFEQRPQSAVEFCRKWTEKYPTQLKPRPTFDNHPIDNINLLSENLFQVEVNKIAGKSYDLPKLLEIEVEISDYISASLSNYHVLQVSQFQKGKSFTEELSETREQLNNMKGQKTFSQNNAIIHEAELALIMADHGYFDDANLLLPNPNAPLPTDPHLLFSISKVSQQAGNLSRAVETAKLTMDILDQDQQIHLIPVWGDYLSLTNLGRLLIDLHMTDQASRILKLASQKCPNDSSVLKLLADSYKYSHKDHEAADILKALVSLHPNNLDYRRLFAQYLEDLNDWETSLNERANIVNSKQNKSSSVPQEDLYAYAKCALNANNIPLTLSICSDLLSKDQEDCQALIYSGEAYLRIGETEKGMEFLIQATQNSPHVPEGWLALAEAQKSIFPTKTVIETLLNGSKAVPNSYKIHFALGELYLLDNTPTLALPELHSAVTLSPENPQILVNYGRALKLVGNIEECRVVLTKAYQLEPNFPGLAKQYAKLLVDQGALEEAIPPLELLVNSKFSEDITVYMDYARVVLTLNELGSTQFPPMKALIALNEVLQIDPTNVEAKALIAESLAASGDNEMAFQAYREALDTPLIEDKNWLERLSFGFGCVANMIGKYDIAIAALQEAGQINPSNPAIFKSLSNAFLSANLLEDSIRSARNVLVIDGDNPDNLAWFANQATNLIWNSKGDFSTPSSSFSKTISTEALNALIKAIHLAPTRTDLLIQLGNYQSSLGASAEAQETFASIAYLDFAAIDDLKSAAEYLSGIGNHSEAIACLENGILQDQKSVNKHDTSLYVKLAQEYVNNDDHTSAINTLDKAIEILPGDSSLITQKIKILLDLSQPIEALNCIETSIQENTAEKPDIDLIFLASKINRSIGDLYTAVKYTQKGIAISREVSGNEDLSTLPPHYQTQISEIFRALIQPVLAYEIIKGINILSPQDFTNEQDYLDYICLNTELALDAGDLIKPEIQDLQLDISNPIFSRLMAIKARLMNKAGNYKQAEQILQIAINSYLKQDLNTILPGWEIAHTKYLNMNSIIEAALDLGLWEHAVNGSLRIIDFSSGEPLSYLNLAKATVLEAEFYNLCEILDVSNHQPSREAISKETLNQLMKYLDNVKSILGLYKADQFINGLEFTDEQIYRWQARADIAFNQFGETDQVTVEVLAPNLAPDDASAVIYHLHQIDLHVPECNSINRIIKIARTFPRNPLVLLHVALAIYEDNPEDAIKSLQSVLDQHPYSRIPIIAFCGILLAKIALNLGEYGVAQKAVENAIEIWQDEPGWHYIAAKICKEISDSTGAINHLLEATSLSPKNSSYQLELGKLYFDNADDDPHKIKQALKSFENALELNPNDISSLLLLASTQYKLNDLVNAEKNTRNALVIDPNRADIYQLLSEIAIRNDDFQGAYNYANHAIQLSPKDLHSTIILARALSALGRYNEALAKLNTMVPTAPDPKYLHLERIKILQQINGSKGVLEELQKLVNSYPEDFNILSALAKVYVEIDETNNAILTAQQALEICPEKTPRNEQASIHLLIGKVLHQTGQLDQSIFHLNEAIHLAPDRLEPYLELGLALKERREYQQAIQLFEQATSIAPDDPRAPYQAGLALKESKDYRSSETMLRRAVTLAPHDLNIRRQLAAVVALNLVHNPRTDRN